MLEGKGIMQCGNREEFLKAESRARQSAGDDTVQQCSPFKIQIMEVIFQFARKFLLSY